MDRRAFIVGAAGGVLAAGKVGAGGAQASDPGPRIATYVTNLRDHATQGAVPPLGEAVELRRVSGRTYDPLSVAVFTRDGRRLGYLPRVHGQVVAPLMDAGLGFSAIVTRSTGGAVPRLDLALAMAGAGTATF